jgi:hypothetical protein
MSVRIYVDFNTMAMDPQERVSINTEVQQNLATRLSSGLTVVLYDEEMEVEGTAVFDVEHQQWFAQPRWETRRDLPLPEKTATKVA